jgi:hypothetical protein
MCATRSIAAVTATLRLLRLMLQTQIANVAA